MLYQQNEPDYIVQSKMRCQKLGIDPTKIPRYKIKSTDRLREKQTEFSTIFPIIHLFTHKFLQSVKGTPMLIGVTDETGLVLEMHGDDSIKSMIQQLGINPGVQFTEEETGTNSISLALRFKKPIEVIGTNHYHQFVHRSACYTVPFHYNDLENVFGTISIMTTLDHSNQFLLTLLSTVVDSIERELLLRKQNHRLNIFNQVIVDNSNNGLIITDLDGAIIESNQFAQINFGFKKEDLLGHHVSKLDTIGPYIEQVIEKQQHYKDIQLIINRDDQDTHIVCLFDAFPLYDENCVLIGAFATFRDITERFTFEEKINYMAYHDDLTNLANRRLFNKSLEEAINEAQHENKTLGLFYLDLDRFKMVNDTLGHMSGDLLLCEVAIRLKSCIGNKGIVSRLAGDEFAIFIPHISDSIKAASIAEDLIGCFKEPFIIKNDEFHITTSIGISFYPFDGQELKSLLIQADIAMKRAKELGKNGYLMYSPSMDGNVYQKWTLENALRNVIEKDELILHYQPQIELKTGRIMGLEALLRWNHPEFGMIMPDQFIPLAEETGLIVPIGEWVLRAACKQTKQWQAMGLPLTRISVNLSIRQFLRSGLVQQVEDILRETELDPSFLELEITESMAIDVDYSIRVLKDLTELGVKISMDDFGKGYSSLSYLKNFSLNRLKIDQSFVRDVMNDANDAVIVRTIISMAQSLGLEVIAEGAETRDQVTFLSDLGCNEVQGYYFSRPLPRREVEKLLCSTFNYDLGGFFKDHEKSC